MSNHKARKSLANHKRIQISPQTCGVSEQAFGSRNVADYTVSRFWVTRPAATQATENELSSSVGSNFPMGWGVQQNWNLHTPPPFSTIGCVHVSLYVSQRVDMVLSTQLIAFIRGSGVYLRSRCLFEIGILNQDYVSWLHTSSLSTTIFEFYTLIYTLIFKPNYCLQKYRKYRIRCNPSNQLCRWF